jgi:hypothetical protein
MAQWAQHKVAAAGIWDASHRFKVYSIRELHNLEYFRDLGRVFLRDDNNVLYTRHNLKRA